MIRLTADEAMLATLRQATGPAEICDRQGQLVGVYAPMPAGPPPPIGPATEADLPEIKRRIATERGGKTLREVFEHLKSITPEPVAQAYLQKKIDQLAERDRCDSP